MRRYLLAGAIALTAIATGHSGLLAAGQGVQQQEGLPGRTVPARVIVSNHDRAEAIPVVLQDQKDMPPMRATIVGTQRVAADRQAWEYKQLIVPGDQSPTSALNTLGIDGWEAVGLIQTSSGTSILLKRPH